MKKNFLFVLSFLLLVAFSATFASAASVYLTEADALTPSPGDLNVTIDPSMFGGTLTLNAYLHFTVADDVSGNLGPYGATFSLFYDRDVTIEAASAEVDTLLWSLAEGSIITCKHDENVVDFNIVDYWDQEQLPYGEYRLGSVTFDIAPIAAIGTMTTLELAQSDNTGDFMAWSRNAFDENVTFYGATVNVVPIPGTVLLLGFGLLGLMGIGRRRMIKS